MNLERPKALCERALLRAAKLVLQARPAPLPDWRARPHRVLFLRHDKIGDMVMSTGVIRAIAESHATMTLDVLASRSNAPVLEELPFVNEVLVLDGVTEGEPPRAVLRATRALRARRYDAVIDGLVLNHDVSPMVAMLMAACGAPRRIGVGACTGKLRGGLAAYTHTIEPPSDPDANHVDYLAVLAGPFGVEPAEVPHPALRITAVEEKWAERAWQEADRNQHPVHATGIRPRLLVNVSAGHWRRRWGDAQFIAAIRQVRAAHDRCTVLVVGEPTERAAVKLIAVHSGVTAPATASVRTAFALVACSDGVLTPDTSIAHAASAFRKPCVTLMLPGAERFTPYHTPGRVVMSATMEMSSVPVTDVTRALDELLGFMASHAGVVRAATPLRTNPGS